MLRRHSRFLAALGVLLLALLTQLHVGASANATGAGSSASVAPVITAALDSLNFPPTNQGEDVAMALSVNNTGDADLIITGATTTNPVFSVITSFPGMEFPVVVSPATGVNIFIDFAPIDTILYTGDLIIESNDPVTPSLVVPTKGQGVLLPPEIFVDPTFLSGWVYVDGHSCRGFYIKNFGYQPLEYSIDDSGFPSWLSLSSTSGSLTGIGSAVGIQACCDPIGIPADSTLTHTFYIDHNDSTTGSVAVTIQMVTILPPMPQIELSDTVFVFVDRFVPDTDEASLTVSNTGPDRLNVDLVPSSSQYVASDPSFSLFGGENHSSSIVFAPNSSGIHDDSLRVLSNDPDEGLVFVRLYGRAVNLSEFTTYPDSLTDTLPPAGEHTLTAAIQHPGGFDTGFVLRAFVIHPEDPQGSPALVATPGPVETGKTVALPTWETGVAMGGDEQVTATSPSPMWVPMPFVDDFEDGDYAGWQSGGATAVHTITSTFAANGTSFSLCESQSEGGHSNGLYLEFGFVRPTNVSFWVRPTSTTQNTCYVTFHDRNFNEVIYFFALSTGQLYINANVGGNTSVAYQADTWYHIELRNVDFDAQSFDYYVDDALIQSGVPFRNAGSITNIARMDIYNHTANATGYWDEFEIQSDYPNWLSASPDTVIVPAGGTKDVTFCTDATGLPAGTYHGYVDINSVDRPVTAVTVPVTITVDTTITAVSGETPTSTALKQNYPNPFNPTTNIEFFVHDGGHAELAVFDVGGRHVRTLFSRDRALGRYVVSWDGRDQGGERVASGIYFYRLQTDDTATTRKMVLLK